MAEIRCPMCGKPNPDTLDVCQFCQARLKPLIAQSPDEPTPPEKSSAPQPEKPESASESSDFMDWGAFDTGALGETDDTPFDDDADDWLSRLGDDSEPAGEPAMEQSPAAPAEEEPALPAWMTADEETPAPASDPESDIPDWLTDSTAAESELPAEEEPAIPDWLTAGDAEAASEPEEGLPDWLTADSETPAEPAAPAMETEQPDWMSQFGQQDTIPIESDADLPDWLTGEDEDTKPAAASTPPFVSDDTDEAADLPDWMSGEPETASAEETPAATESTGVTDFLARIGAEESVETPPESPAEQADLPDWLADMSEPAASEPATPAFAAEESELPDWLRSEPESAASEPAPAEEVPAAEAEVPDWLADMEASTSDAEEGKFAEAADLPDWLQEESAEAPVSEEPAAEESDLPDWLADAGESATPSEPAFTAEAADLPDWLKGEAEEPPTSEEPAAVEADLPEWLADAAAEEPLVPATAELPPAPEDETPELAAEAEVPDWLADMEESAAETETGQPAEAGEIPDWLKAAGGAAIAAGVAAAASDETEAAEAELPSWLAEDETSAEAPPAEEAEELPDWLAELDGFAPPPDEETGPSGPEIPVDESRAVPDWLREIEGPSPEPESTPFERVPEFEIPEETPFTSDEEFEDDLFEVGQLPDLSGDDLRAADEPISQPAADDLTPAELPGWLAAMRPVESAPTPEGESGEVETVGPLAGLNNVLAAQPDVIRLKKPPAYSSKLQVSESQQAHATLLHEMLETENKPRPLPLPHLITSHRLFKGALGALLLIIAFLAVLAGTDMVALPALPEMR
jgi:hypothetical protein